MTTLVMALVMSLSPSASLETDLPMRHPHCPKKVEIQVPKAGTREMVKMSVSHLTVTFNKEGFEETKPQGTWHLANAHFETAAKVRLGGQVVEPGDYSLLARKVSDDAWELVLDKGARFRTKLSDEARALKTEFLSKQPKSEHLRVDINPAGDTGERGLSTVFLEVHFETHLARAKVEIL